MELIRFCGDIHGDFDCLKKLSMDDTVDKVVQVGDCGIGFSKPWPDDMPSKVRFIRGNHDDLNKCKEIPNFIPDGTVENDIMYCGGAYSIDRDMRIPGVSWWYNEELNDYEFETILDIYKVAQPRVMVTHDLPHGIMEKIVKNIRKPFFETTTTHWLKEMFDFHKPEIWFLGHHHPVEHIIKKVDGTTFCIIPINAYVDFGH